MGARRAPIGSGVLSECGLATSVACGDHRPPPRRSRGKSRGARAVARRRI